MGTIVNSAASITKDIGIDVPHLNLNLNLNRNINLNCNIEAVLLLPKEKKEDGLIPTQ